MSAWPAREPLKKVFESVLLTGICRFRHIELSIHPVSHVSFVVWPVICTTSPTYEACQESGLESLVPPNQL
jgi:hypothetical protein